MTKTLDYELLVEKFNQGDESAFDRIVEGYSADIAVLANLSTKMTLAQQEIRSFEEQLKEAEDLLGKADEYELLSLKADIARQNLEETLLWHARLGRNNRSIQPPDVTVIGAE
ncbi:MAG: hypothetical protein WBC22_02690 [Sedimentisphaerales bacterium]